MKFMAAGMALLTAGISSGVGAEQAVHGPVAVYWMSAATTSGIMGSVLGGSSLGGRPDARSMMGMALGGAQNPNAFSHSLLLQLGSAHSPAGQPPAAEHDPPVELGAGSVLPLVSPAPQAPAVHQEAEPGPPPQYRQPHGRMLIFWGCGEHAGPGQPVVIDFASLGQGGAQKMMELSRGLGVTPMQPPSPLRNTSYGEWPNAQSDTQVPPDGSLQGAHRIHGNYSPDINFNLAANQDFLPPFRLTANEKLSSGAANLAWRPVDGAAAYAATMIGAQGRDEVVMWTSSATQAAAFALPDYLSDHEIARLVASRTLMGSAQTSCPIPSEAVQAAGRSGFFNLVAYGNETNIAYPPRPPPPQPWNIAWEVKVRYRSATSGIVGMDMSRMMGRGNAGPRDQDQPPPPPPPKRHGFLPNIGDLVPVPH